MKLSAARLAREQAARALGFTGLGLTGRTWHVGLMAGGGVKGAVTVEPLLHAISHLPAGQRFDAWLGTSVGALHAAVLGSGHDQAAQRSRLELIRQIYLDITGPESIVEIPWPGGAIGKGRSLLEGGGIYRFKGLRDLLRRHVDQPGLAHIDAPYTAVVTVGLESGTTVAITPENPKFLQYVIASAAAPAMAQAERIDGVTWVDGGVTDILPFRQALAWIKTVAAPEDRVIFYCFLTGPREPKRMPAIRHGLDVLFRSLELTLNAQARLHIDRILASNDRLLNASPDQSPPDHRLIEMVVYEPTIYGPAAYDFRPEGIRQLLAHGAELAPSTGFIAA